MCNFVGVCVSCVLVWNLYCDDGHSQDGRYRVHCRAQIRYHLVVCQSVVNISAHRLVSQTTRLANLALGFEATLVHEVTSEVHLSPASKAWAPPGVF
jgi:hypothetical protein